MFIRQSRTIHAVLVEDYMGSIHVKLFKKYACSLGGVDVFNRAEQNGLCHFGTL